LWKYSDPIFGKFIGFTIAYFYLLTAKQQAVKTLSQFKTAQLSADSISKETFSKAFLQVAPHVI
jgi:hypothetical protein